MSIVRTPGPAAPALAVALSRLGGIVGHAGWLEGGGGAAARREFGDPATGQPPQPLLRAAMAEADAAWAATARTAAAAVLTGAVPPTAVAEAIARAAAADLTRAVAQAAPDLANRVTYRVEEEA